jgi:hypothetical protein
VAALPAGIAVGITFAAGVNLYYDVHPVYFVATAVALAVTWPLSVASLRAFGVGRRLALMLPPVIAAVWTGLFFLEQWHAYPDLSAAARLHSVVLRALPVYPGARLTAEDTSGRWGADEDFAEGFLNQPTHILTTWTWRLPPHASARAVADWYELRLHQAGWHVNRDDLDTSEVLLPASRDNLAFEDPRDAPLEVDVYGTRRARYRNFPGPSHPEVTATAGP